MLWGEGKKILTTMTEYTERWQTVTIFFFFKQGTRTVNCCVAKFRVNGEKNQMGSSIIISEFQQN